MLGYTSKSLHQAGQTYKILGTHGTLVRLSRVSDCAKLMMIAEDLYLAHGESEVARVCTANA